MEKPKVAVVTGGGRGIGLAIAARLASLGPAEEPMPEQNGENEVLAEMRDLVEPLRQTDIVARQRRDR